MNNRETRSGVVLNTLILIDFQILLQIRDGDVNHLYFFSVFFLFFFFFEALRLGGLPW